MKAGLRPLALSCGLALVVAHPVRGFAAERCPVPAGSVGLEDVPEDKARGIALGTTF